MAKSKTLETLEHPGLPARTNWQRFIKNTAPVNSLTSIETNLYSDTMLIGALESKENWFYSKDGGPYTVFYAFCDGEDIIESAVHPRYIFRAVLVPDGSRWPQPVEGIELEHEVAALLTLETGARILSGSRTRHLSPEFPGGSPRGEQCHPGQIHMRSPVNWIVPGFEKLTGVHDCDRFVTYPRLSKANAATLTRAAMSYSAAPWICESQPELAWLLLVSALECVATELPPATEATLGLPEELTTVAEALPSDQREILEAYIQERSRLTRKFLGLLERHLPPAPRQWIKHEPTRPSQGALDWSWSSLKALLHRIYVMRSKRLHAGVHFPAWTCQRPRRVSEQMDLVWEYEPRPNGVEHAGVPDLTLNTFAYIARGTVLNWWSSVASGGFGSAGAKA